jgi:hypothetical protein
LSKSSSGCRAQIITLLPHGTSSDLICERLTIDVRFLGTLHHQMHPNSHPHPFIVWNKTYCAGRQAASYRDMLQSPRYSMDGAIRHDLSHAAYRIISSKKIGGTCRRGEARLFLQSPERFNQF